MMSPDDPRHGQYSGWAQHEREGSEACEPCWEARRRYQRVRPHLHKLGRPPRIRLGDALYRKALAILATDLPERYIEQSTGVSISTLNRIRHAGPDTLVRRCTAERLTRYDVDEAAARQLTHIGMVRRLQALYAIGHYAAEISAYSGLCDDAIQQMVRGATKVSAYDTRERVAKAYAALEFEAVDHARNKFASRAVNRARREGWAPPFAWEHIDDPDEVPTGHRFPTRPWKRRSSEIDHAVVQRRLAGDKSVPTTHAERIEILREAFRLGWSFKQIERTTGLKPDPYLKELRGAAS